jgi:hypothetical protein
MEENKMETQKYIALYEHRYTKSVPVFDEFDEPFQTVTGIEVRYINARNLEAAKKMTEKYGAAMKEGGMKLVGLAKLVQGSTGAIRHLEGY